MKEPSQHTPDRLEKLLAGRAERLSKLIHLNAPKPLIFNEKKLVDDAFKAWCEANDLDHTQEWDNSFQRVT